MIQSDEEIELLEDYEPIDKPKTSIEAIVLELEKEIEIRSGKVDKIEEEKIVLSKFKPIRRDEDILII